MALYRRGVIAVEFDGTIVQHAYPQIGEEMPGAVEALKKLQKHWAIALNTCREDLGSGKRYLSEAVDWCRERGIELAGVNETPKEFEFRPANVTGRKIHAHIYIDDRNFGGLPSWDVIVDDLLRNEESIEVSGDSD